MPDTYSSFSELAHCERRNVDYQVVACVRPSPVLVLAPHGGGIEPGTSELARAIAGDRYSFYCFEGLKTANNERLHLASHLFDEPLASAMVQTADIIVALHGCTRSGERVWVGGRDTALGDMIKNSLTHARIAAERDRSDELSGTLPYNLCNRGRTGQGCQLELTKDLRLTLFESLNRQGREYKLHRFDQFAAAVKAAIDTAIR
jgi:phage replication-related protein YjqB (UPF0714/DUF867 family)